MPTCPPSLFSSGAGGKTGGLVLKKLAERKDQFMPVAVVRGEQVGGPFVAGGVVRREQVRIIDFRAYRSRRFAKVGLGWP